MQGLWVFLCSLPVLILNSKKAGEERCAWPAPTDAAGMLLYVVGLAVEVSAAEQTFGMLFEVGLTRLDSTPTTVTPADDGRLPEARLPQRQPQPGEVDQRGPLEVR